MAHSSPPLGEEATGASSPDASFGLDFMEQLPQLEIPECSTLFNPGASSSPAFALLDSYQVSALPERNGSSCVPEFLEKEEQSGEQRLDPSSLLPSVQVQREEERIVGIDGRGQDSHLVEPPVHTYGSGMSSSKRSIVSPEVNGNVAPSIKERLMYALRYIKDSHKEYGILVQIWVPVMEGGQHVLTTCDQPFWLDHQFQRLASYRTVSTNYHFSAVKNCKQALGLPGRVFVERMPEWTPDVRFFNSDEYPRVNYAQHYDVRGSVAVPFFERGKYPCLGVLEIVMINEKVNYDVDLENICNALQAVDLGSSAAKTAPEVWAKSNSYDGALPEIFEVLRVVCQKLELPLAQTWIPCIQQGKSGPRHSNENYQHCVSTVDVACYVHDASFSGFHRACSEHHLFIGEGLVGRAFTSNQPCFSSDVTALNRVRYPLSHHARIFNLHGAVAMRLRSSQTGTIDFVLEFFFPTDCIGFEMQKLTLKALYATVQEVSRTLRVVTELELARERMTFVGHAISSVEPHEKEVSGVERTLNCGGITVPGALQVPAYLSHDLFSVSPNFVENQTNDKGWFFSSKHLSFEEGGALNSGVSLQRGNAEMLSRGDLFSVFIKTQDDLAGMVNINASSLIHESGANSEKKTSKKKRGKEKTQISLDALQKHFAGTLKGAAKNLGVCPTTLKRNCREHGIKRWPSRKIKKVGNSLKKLQKVIDSVQGAEGSPDVKLLYSEIAEVKNSDLIAQTAKGNNGFSISMRSSQPKPTEGEGEDIHCTVSSSSLSSSDAYGLCPSSSSSKQLSEPTNTEIKGKSFADEGGTSNIRTPVETELLHQLAANPEFFEAKSKAKNLPVRNDNFLRVKANLGDDIVRFKFQLICGLQDLKLEIAKRFSIENVNSMSLKYLDDDSEWVLLTCDDDLNECVDVHVASSSQTIKISVDFH